MKNQIIYLEENNYKTFGFDENLILASSKRHDDFNSILASAEKKGMLENFIKIEMESIVALDYSEEDQILNVGYLNSKGKKKSTGFNFSIPGTKEKVAASISELKGFTKNEIAESTTKPLLINILGLIATIIGTGLFAWISKESAAGVAYESGGRRGARNEAVYDMLGNVPSELIILIGIAGFGWLTYKTYLRYQNPQIETHYS